MPHGCIMECLQQQGSRVRSMGDEMIVNYLYYLRLQPTARESLVEK